MWVAETPPASGSASNEEVAETTNVAAQTLIYPREDLPPPKFTEEGVEIEDESPPALTPLSNEFECYKYKFSDCGKFEIIGDRWILRKKNSQRVPGVLPELWSLLSQEQRTALRQRWHLYLEELVVNEPPGFSPASEEGGLADAAPAPAAPASTKTKLEANEGTKRVAETPPTPPKLSHGKGSVATAPRIPCPAMPVVPPGLTEHREHFISDPNMSLMAMVARSVTRKEVDSTPAAAQSLKDEAAKRVQKGAWDPSGAREWQVVADE
ncbi:MAG: hypothetical protein EBZ67_15480, partial [Chitinophagia bacterium]|nr:hypothetical protein [Chitinophagia bacterium]